jgi:hypothetical protein
METLGIALYLIGGLVAAPVFCLILVKVIRRFPKWASAGFWIAVPLLVGVSIEIAIVRALGIIGTRDLVGPLYFLLHVLLTFSAAPALACLLLLGRRSIKGGWPVAAFICWWVGAVAIFYQYNVAETLYGIGGFGGPYQSPW